MPKKPQHLPHAHAPIRYGERVKYATTKPYSPLLDKDGIHRIKTILGFLLYYACAVNKKLLVPLNAMR